jgi:hypothetical protein
MNDPHVESLTYELETEESVSFDAPPVEHETEAFSLRLEEGTVHVDLKQHFAFVEEARNHVEHFLDSWKVKNGVDRGRTEFTFSFEDSEVVDRDPPGEGESVVISPDSLEHAHAIDKVEAHITRAEYPNPPDHFRLSPNAHMLWGWYQQYEEGRRLLMPMAFAVRSQLKDWAGETTAAKDQYRISNQVWSKIGNLTTTREGESGARKPEAVEREATSQEQKWVKEAVREIIRHVGIHDAGHDLRKLTMDDLPGLE